MEQYNNTSNTGVPPIQDFSLPPKKGSLVPLIGAAVAIIILAIGGFYFWEANLNQENATDNMPSVASRDDSGLPPTSSSDTVADIEADVSATDIDTLDAQIEADMKTVESSL